MGARRGGEPDQHKANCIPIHCIYGLQLNPGNSNFQGKSKLLRVIGVSSYRGFEQKDQKHLIKVFLCLDMFYCRVFSNVKCKNDKTKQKHENRK